MTAQTSHAGWIVVDTARDFALAHYRDHADADAHCDRAEARTGIRCATERRYRTVTAIGEDAARYLQQIRMHGLPSQVEADKPSPPWQTLGQPGGRRVGANGERFDFAVRWDMETTAPGMSGYRSVSRRFATADEAIAAIAAGMARAYRATAFDAASREIATRRNLAHRRNRRATSATDARAPAHRPAPHQPKAGRRGRADRAAGQHRRPAPVWRHLTGAAAVSRYGRAPGTKNSCGVYEPTESIEHPQKHGGCSPLAEIHMLQRPEGWRVVVAYSFTSGSWAGASSPLMDNDPVFPTRDIALRAGVAALRRRARVYLTDPKMAGQVRKIEAWLDEILPAQADLFA